VTQLLVKLLLAPSFVVGASLAARRFGPRVGGLVAGLPVVAGPILLAYALAHGKSFAAGAAAGTLLGLVSLVAFSTVYARLAPRLHWLPCLLCGWLTFAVCTALFSAFTIPDGVSLALAAAAIAGGLALIPRPPDATEAPEPLPSWDLPLRAACALALVLVLTAIAGWLGPQLSGLLAPFPIVATVLTTFTHGQHGVEQMRRLVRGMVSGFAAFALFFFTLAVTLRSLGDAEGFALALVVALLVQAAAFALTRPRPRTALASREPGIETTLP
jgi:hypothetical protein